VHWLVVIKTIKMHGTGIKINMYPLFEILYIGYRSRNFHNKIIWVYIYIYLCIYIYIYAQIL